MSSKSALPLAPIDAASFRMACARFATGVTVATVLGTDGEPQGFTANSFTSVSCCPPLILICIDHRTTALPHFRANPLFGINILAECQRDVSVRFSQRQANRFEGIEWWLSDSGIPLLGGTLARLECSATQTLDAGDHTIFIGEVFHADWGEGRPLLFYSSRYGELAIAPRHVR
ncbi:MAG TPA: flavin reductase family protein [Bryobacteraceae bacterium]|nr:flavin reductase family protein [Bryobacteraceae bacterium]